jgi:predicted chitinase
MGSIEKEVYFNEAIFRDLQFDTPGEYVISVVPSTPDIEATEWQITVKPDPNAAQESRAKEEEKVDGTRPVITQIDKTTMTLPAIEWGTSPDKQLNAEIATNIGYQPFFWYAGYQVPPANITSLTLYHDGVVPNVAIIFYDSIGFIKKEGMPLDNSKIEVFLNSGSNNLKSIHLRFKIVKFQENRGGTYTIHGILDLKDFYKQSYKSYTGTSFEILRMISKENELGFNSNIESTQDSMKWSNTGKTPAQFMSEVMKHSYISDAAFVGGYIDYYYCFNYVDIEKEWTRDISGDIGIDSQGPVSKTIVDPPGGEKSLIRSLSFTNDKSQSGSSFHIAKFEVNNNSTSKSLKKGQFTITKYYDSSKKSFLIFNVDSLTSDDGKNLILKGATTDKTELETNYKTEYLGRIETENVHANYMYAEIQNKTNFNNLTRITIDMELSNANFNIYKFQKVKLLLVNPTPTVSLPELNYERISGEWIIADIEYVWTNNRMSQKLVAVRKELGKTKEERETQKEEKKEEKGDVERNENPVDTPTGIVPNTVYKVGEYYSAVDKSGRIFSIEITEVSSNGIEVTGNIIEIPKPPPPPPRPPNPPAEAPKLEDNSDETSPGNSGTGSDFDEKAKPKRSENPPAGVLKRMKDYGITKPLEQAHFIAQIAVESGQFQYTSELGDNKYLSKYNGRTDLGNTSPGDGPKYKGRGYMQLTGKANYKEYAKYLKEKGVKDWDVVSNPDWVSTKYPADVSCYFWMISGPKSVKKFSKKAAEGSSTTIINKIGAWINGKNPPNGSSERIAAFKKYWAILQSDPKKYS